MVPFEVHVKLKYTLMKHGASKLFVEANSVNQMILFSPKVLWSYTCTYRGRKAPWRSEA